MSEWDKQRELGMIRLYDHDIWAALDGANLSFARLHKLRAALESEYRVREQARSDRVNAYRTISDLQTHLRDRDAYIKTLEAELRPHLLQQEPPTESML